MFQKLIVLVYLSTLPIMSLNVGDSLSSEIESQLKLERDKLYIIDFFASWCESCHKELPLISKLYAEKKNLNIIGINVDKDEEKAKAFVMNVELKFPIVYDSKQSLIEVFEPIGFPTLYYIKNGKIVKIIVGAVNEIDKKIEEDVKELK